VSPEKKLESERKKRTILVVDDDEGIRGLFSRSFKDDDLYSCESAEDAFRILESLKFDVMIIDIKLPGIDGCSFCSDIRADYPDTFILAMTGYASKFEFLACKSAGFDGYFHKPLNLKTLHQVINEHFKNKMAQSNK
jgi:CheY-like chemotaxis protein